MKERKGRKGGTSTDLINTIQIKAGEKNRKKEGDQTEGVGEREETKRGEKTNKREKERDTIIEIEREGKGEREGERDIYRDREKVGAGRQRER